MSNEYIPVATADTAYYKPETQEEFEQITEQKKLGDMIFSKENTTADPMHHSKGTAIYGSCLF